MSGEVVAISSVVAMARLLRIHVKLVFPKKKG